MCGTLKNNNYEFQGDEEMDYKVESFLLDHTKVKAPYVRKAATITGPKGDIITKFDLRFLQPNSDSLPTGALHTLEHLLSTYLREEMENVVDLSPMGCRTGFYLVMLEDAQEEKVKKALVSSLSKVLVTTEVPAMTAKECGNYRDHSLFGAVEYARQVLDGFAALDEKRNG